MIPPIFDTIVNNFVDFIGIVVALVLATLAWVVPIAIYLYLVLWLFDVSERIVNYIKRSMRNDTTRNIE
jgi:uncharacterized membrane protein